MTLVWREAGGMVVAPISSASAFQTLEVGYNVVEMQLSADPHCRGAQQSGGKLCPKELAAWLSTTDEGGKMITAKDLEVASVLQVPSEGESAFLVQFLP